LPDTLVEADRAEDLDSNLISGIRALACHGHTMDWLVNVIGLPPRIVAREYRPAPIDFILVPDVSFASATFPPPVPPPRLCAG
jgi:hypothetical protein